MKKVIFFMVSAFILVGAVEVGYNSLITKQLSNAEEYLAQNGYEVEEVSFKDNAFHIAVKVSSSEEDIVTDYLKKDELMSSIQTNAIYFNCAMTLSFVIA